MDSALTDFVRMLQTNGPQAIIVICALVVLLVLLFWFIEMNHTLRS